MNNMGMQIGASPVTTEIQERATLRKFLKLLGSSPIFGLVLFVFVTIFPPFS